MATVTQRGHAGHLGPAPTHLSGQSPSPTMVATLDDGEGWWDSLGKAAAARSHPRRRHNCSDELDNYRLRRLASKHQETTVGLAEVMDGVENDRGGLTTCSRAKW